MLENSRNVSQLMDQNLRTRDKTVQRPVAGPFEICATGKAWTCRLDRTDATVADSSLGWPMLTVEDKG